jgi:AraC-like DNA-binding protein
MYEQLYEHHTSLLKDKLCPFKLNICDAVINNPFSNWHKNIEILLITDGNGVAQYGKDELLIKKDDIIVVNSGILHHFNSNTGISYYCLIIDESFVHENGLDTEKQLFTKIFTDDKCKNYILNAINALNNYYSDRENIVKRAKARNCMLNLLIDLYENHTQFETVNECRKKPSENYIKQAIEYLNSNFMEKIDLDEISNICGITKYYLAREFKRFTGQTIVTYANFLKCKKGEFLLSQGMTVSEAAYECGFDSVSYFSSTYKKVMGYPPSKAK